MVKAQTPDWDWYVRGGGPVQEYGKAISRDPQSGDLFVAGSFNVNTTATGSALFENQTLTSAGAGDVLLARYSKAGRLQWAVAAGGTGDDGAQAVAVDSVTGHVLITGEYSARAAFGADTLPAANGQDFFLACYDRTGALLWTRSGTGPNYTAGRALALDSAGNIYVGGVYETRLTLNGSALAANQPGKNLFVASFAANGQLRWLQSTNSSTATHIEARGLAVGQGRLLFTGGFNQMIHFGATMLMTSNASDGDIFLAAFGLANGSVQQAVQFGSRTAALEQGNALATDRAGRPVLVGQYSGSATIAGQGLSGRNGLDIFVARLNPNLSTAQWVRTAQGPNYTDFAAALTLDSADNAYVCGSFMGELQFSNGGPLLMGNAPNDQDAWVAKFDPNGQVLYARPAGAAQFSVDGAFGISTDGRGHVFTTGYLVRQSAQFGNLARCESFGQLDLFVASINEAGGSLPVFFLTDTQTSPTEFRLTGQNLQDTWRVDYEGVPVSQFSSTATQLTVTLPPGAPPTGTLTAYNTRGCATRLLQAMPTAVAADYDHPTGYQCAPNPATTDIALSHLSPNVTVVLTDLLGRCVQKGRAASDGRLTLPVSSLPAGLYVVKPDDAPAQRVLVSSTK